MQMEIGMTFEMRYALAEIDRRTADRAVHVITFFKKKFGQKRSVLTGDTCY